MTEIGQEFRDLLARIRAGSEEAAQQMLQRYGRHLLYIIRGRMHRKLRSKFDSLDFLQDVWASFFAHPPPQHAFDGPEAFIAFLTRLANNKVAEVTRQRLTGHKFNVNREHSLDGSARIEALRLVDPHAVPVEEVSTDEQWDRLLDTLPVRDQRILRLLRQGHSHLEIARHLGIHEKTVERLVRRIAWRLSS
jgi:RNA polymerase sigma-70 factor (ECF subfamily)